MEDHDIDPPNTIKIVPAKSFYNYSKTLMQESLTRILDELNAIEDLEDRVPLTLEEAGFSDQEIGIVEDALFTLWGEKNKSTYELARSIQEITDYLGKDD
jgi:hypothetical protein